MLTIVEPQRGKTILESLNHRASSSPALFHAVSISADIFVFVYPVLLICMYFYGYTKKQKAYQIGGLSILVSGIVAIATNLIIQQFIRKTRPETLPGLQLILSHVPTISFPSDHAAISMAMAVGFYCISGKLKTEGGRSIIYDTLSFSLLAFSLIMGLARIAVAIHWPTDILAGWIIGAIGGYLGRKLSCSSFGLKTLNKLIAFGNGIVDRALPGVSKS